MNNGEISVMLWDWWAYRVDYGETLDERGRLGDALWYRVVDHEELSYITRRDREESR